MDQGPTQTREDMGGSEVFVIFRKLFVRVIDINLRGGGAPE